MLTLLLLSLSLQVAEPDVVASFTSRTRGVEWNFKLTQAMLDQSPTWGEDDQWPPLSPKRAIEAALQQLGTLVDDRERWRFESVALKQVGPKQAWIYVVQISEPPPRPDGGIHSWIEMIVLLDGTAVPPTRQPLPAR